jgi:hypothetical protein
MEKVLLVLMSVKEHTRQLGVGIKAEEIAHNPFNMAQLAADSLNASVITEKTCTVQVEIAVSWVELFSKNQCVDGRYGAYAQMVNIAIVELIDVRSAEVRLAQRAIIVVDNAENEESSSSSYTGTPDDEPELVKATPSTLEGFWLVDCTGPGGEQDLKEIHLNRRFGRCKFTNESMGPSAWKAEGTWRCIDDTRIRFEGRGSAYPGGPPMVAFVDLLTIEMTDADHFSSTSPTGVNMEWSRKK